MTKEQLRIEGFNEAQIEVIMKLSNAILYRKVEFRGDGITAEVRIFIGYFKVVFTPETLSAMASHNMYLSVGECMRRNSAYISIFALPAESAS